MEFHGQERRCQHAGVRTPHIKQARPGLSGCECLGDKDRTDRTSLPQEGGWGGRDEGCNRGVCLHGHRGPGAQASGSDSGCESCWSDPRVIT